MKNDPTVHSEHHCIVDGHKLAPDSSELTGHLSLLRQKQIVGTFSWCGLLGSKLSSDFITFTRQPLTLFDESQICIRKIRRK